MQSHLRYMTEKINWLLADGISRLIGQFLVCTAMPQPIRLLETKSVRSSGSNSATIVSILVDHDDIDI